MCSLTKAELFNQRALSQAFFQRCLHYIAVCENVRYVADRFLGRHQVLLISTKVVLTFWWSQLIGGHITWVDLGLVVGCVFLEKRTMWRVNRTWVYQLG